MQTSNRKAIAAAIAGNAMEWYDFTVFALMTPVIKNLFFPVNPNLPGSEINALLLTTALFGTGFFMRPVGGLVLGYFGDRRGRKTAMTLGMALMALSVALLALTPTYATAGIRRSADRARRAAAAGLFGRRRVRHLDRLPDRSRTSGPHRLLRLVADRRSADGQRARRRARAPA